MSWWPFSSAGADAKPSPTQPPSTAQPNPVATQHTAMPSSPSSAPSPDHEFYAAHPHLAPPSLSTPAPSSISTSASPADATSNDDSLDPTLPSTMSCRAAFDSAFYCSSLGGHFHDIYRYGQLRSCSEHWSDFWFCMRTKNSYSGADVKARLIQERYREKEDALKQKPNSEDVWTKRGPGEEIKEPFALAETQE